MSIKVTGTFAPVVRLLGRCPGFRRFIREEDGAAAIEFAMVVAPFLALLFAILETALVFFAGQTLETAVADSGRLIMTGQAQAQSFDKAKFQADICKRLVAMFDCDGLKIDVRTYKEFAGTDTSKPIDKDGKLKEDFKFQPGCPGEIVVVRAMYEWPLVASFLGLDLADLANGKRLLLSTTTFRNEPFSSMC